MGHDFPTDLFPRGFASAKEFDDAAPALAAAEARVRMLRRLGCCLRLSEAFGRHPEIDAVEVHIADGVGMNAKPKGSIADVLLSARLPGGATRRLGLAQTIAIFTGAEGSQDEAAYELGRRALGDFFSPLFELFTSEPQPLPAGLTSPSIAPGPASAIAAALGWPDVHALLEGSEIAAQSERPKASARKRSPL